MFSHPLPRRAERAGLTLIELVVVMVVLAAVAGIVLPLLPGMVKRAHSSTSSTNIAEVSKAVQQHQALYAAYPSNFDTLVTGTGMASYIPGGSSTDFTVIAATADHVETLEESGITTLAQMVESAGGDWNPTFYPYGANSALSPKQAPIATTIAVGTNMATLSLAAKQRLGLATDADTTYVVFGLGGYTTMHGTSLQEAPVHYRDRGEENPNASYARYGVVFQLTAGTQPLKSAKLSQVVAFHDEGVAGLNEHLAEYHGAAQ